MATKRAALIYNPKSGRHSGPGQLPKLLSVLETAGFDTEPRPTPAPGAATAMVRELVAGTGVDAVFGLGGDGTLREVAAGLLGTEVPLGILPAGTANVLAIALGLPGTSMKAATAMASCEVGTFDVGMAEDQPFLMMASGGVDAAVMARPNPWLKKNLGKVGIALSGLGHLGSYRFPEMTLRFGGRTETVGFFSICNIPLFGGPFRLAPEADWHDDELDLVLFRGRTRLATLGLATSVALGSHLRRRDVEMHRVKEVEILGPLPHGLQVDGDVLPLEPPIRVRLAQRRLHVLMPPDLVKRSEQRGGLTVAAGVGG